MAGLQSYLQQKYLYCTCILATNGARDFVACIVYWDDPPICLYSSPLNLLMQLLFLPEVCFALLFTSPSFSKGKTIKNMNYSIMMAKIKIEFMLEQDNRILGS